MGRMSTPEPAPATSTSSVPTNSAPTSSVPTSSVTSERRRIAFAKSVANAAIWVARGLIILAGVVVLWFLIRALWSIVLPTVLALLLSSILWPLNRVLRRALPAVFAALVSLLALVAAVVGVGLLVVPTIASGVADLTSAASKNIEEITVFVAGPPFNFPAFDLEGLINTGAEQLRENSSAVVSGITAGVGTVGSWLVVLLLTLVLTFFCLKDGDKFLAWTRRWTNGRTYVHAANIGAGVWQTLSAYISSQALVALVDAVFIGIGLVILDIPLALPLAVLIFFASFIPIIGAVSTGVLATIVALFSHGWVTALIVLGIVLLVQQLESNVLQPAIVGRVLKIHPAVVLGSVVAGGTLFGIVGAFLAVPTTAAVIVIFRYLRDQSLKVRPAPADPVSPDPGTVDPATIDPVAAAAAAEVSTVDGDGAGDAGSGDGAGDAGDAESVDDAGSSTRPAAPHTP
jgi:predicted PurR-regulated permease PerM